MVKVILEAIADEPELKKSILGAKDKYGSSPLHWAAGYGNLEVVKVILEAVATEPDLKKSILEAVDKDGNTALHYAKNTIMVAALLANGADPTFKNNEGKSAMDSQQALYSDEAISSYLKQAIDKGDFDGVQNIVKHFPQQKTLAMGEINNPANPAQTLLQYAAETNPQLAAGMILLDFKLPAEGQEHANKITGRSAQYDIAKEIGGGILEHYNSSKQNMPKRSNSKSFIHMLDKVIAEPNR